MDNIIEHYKQLQEFKDYCEGITAQEIHYMLRTKILDEFNKNMKQDPDTAERFHAIGFQSAVEACLSLIQKEYLHG